MVLPRDDQRRHDVRRKLTNLAILERELGAVTYRLHELEGQDSSEQANLVKRRAELFAAIAAERKRDP